MLVKECRDYRAALDGTARLTMPDARSVFKLYFLSIVGRDDRARYEWALSRLTRKDFEDAFLAKGFEGVGFVTAFPHIVKVFRFSPRMETILHVRAFKTDDLTVANLEREDDYLEFACYAEALIAAEEYAAWAKADTVADYLAFQCALKDFPVKTAGKLRAYWNA